MIFEAVTAGGCRLYLIGCEESCAAALIDPELSQVDRYKLLAAPCTGGDAQLLPGTVRRPAPARR